MAQAYSCTYMEFVGFRGGGEDQASSFVLSFGEWSRCVDVGVSGQLQPALGLEKNRLIDYGTYMQP